MSSLTAEKLLLKLQRLQVIDQILFNLISSELLRRHKEQLDEKGGVKDLSSS